MKLQELLEGIDLTKSTPIQLKNRNGRVLIPTSGDLAGEGVQATVRHTGQGIVTKSAGITGPTDPAVEFLKIILDNQDNPFFPKIYHARMYRSNTAKDDDHQFLVVQMEKLTPLTSSKIQDAALSLFNQLGFRGDHVDDVARDIDRLASGSMSTSEVDNFLNKTKNPNFKKAVNLILPHMRKHGSDFHGGNWMIRLTGSGPQLVIIDPFPPAVYINQ